MNISGIKKRFPAFIFYSPVFLMLPFIYSHRLLDPELALRFTFLSVIIFGWSAYFIVKNTPVISFFKQGITIAFVCYLAFNAIGILSAINKGGAIAEFLRLSLFFLLYQFLFCRMNSRKSEKAELRDLIICINLCVLIFSFYGFFQLLPYLDKYITQGTAIKVRLDVASTLSNKNFYAETMLMALPFILYGTILFEKAWKIISIVNCVLIVITILILQSVAVFLAFGVSMFVILIFLLRNMKVKNNRNVPVYLSLFILFFIAGIYIYSKTNNYKELKAKIETMQKYVTDSSSLNEISLENSNSIYERIILWRNSFRMIREHPVTGAGLSNWNILFPKYEMGSAPYMNSGMIRFERPHNDFLFTWCETGLPGLLSYLAVFITAIFSCMAVIKKSADANRKWLAIFMMAGCISFVIISFFSFPQQRPFSMIFLMTMLAFIQSGCSSQNNMSSSEMKIKHSNILFISGIVIAIFSFIAGMKRLNAETHLSNALAAQRKKDWHRMAREADRSQSWFFPTDYSATPVKWYMGFANFYAGYPEKGCTYFKEAEEINPYHLQALNDIGTCYDLNQKREEARRYYNKALSIAPHFPDAILNLSVTWYNEGNIDSAYAIISRHKLKGSSAHSKTLTAILYAKSYRIIEGLADSALQTVLMEKIKDDKWLLSVHRNALETNGNFKDVLLRSIN